MWVKVCVWRWMNVDHERRSIDVIVITEYMDSVLTSADR